MKQGWEIKKLGEVCEMYQPKTISTKEMVENGSFPVFGANGIIGKFNKYNHEEPQLLITCRGATCGAVNISEPKSWINGNAMVVRPKDFSIDLKFLEYLFRGGIDLSKTITGAAQPQITRQSLIPIQISFPKSLPEQQRIVSVLDKCFVAIDKAKANAERNLKNAKELFESYLQGVFENGAWETRKLNEITEVKDGTHDSPKYIKEGIPFVTQKNIKPNGLSFDDTKFITETDHEKFYKRSNVTHGDILISMIGANRGMAAVVDDKRVFSIKNVGLIKSSEKINMNYLLFYLKSSLAMKYVLYMSNGGAQEFVGLTALRSFPIPYPPLKQQQTIVRQLDALRAETQKLEAVYQKKITDLEELKKSILQKAFAGELETEKAILE
jgi:type I restriction enzyme S subunit